MVPKLTQWSNTSSYTTVTELLWYNKACELTSILAENRDIFTTQLKQSVLYTITRAG